MPSCMTPNVSKKGNERLLQLQEVAASCGQLHIHMGIILTIAGRCEGTVFGSNPGVRVRAFSKAA